MKHWKLTLLAALTAAALLTGCAGSSAGTAAPEDDRPLVTATVFPAYDFARAVCGELARVELLLPPGAESHSYEPTPRDILDVGASALFLYVGGESDAWVETLLESVDGGVRSMTLMECVDLAPEETLEGMTAAGHGHDHEAHGDPDDHDAHSYAAGEHGEGAVLEYDEHVWTAPANAAAITRAIGERMALTDPDNAAAYRANAAAYAEKLETLDGEFRDFFSASGAQTMVFGDRFPLRYFADAYGLACYAAFPGCSTQTEPSAATVAFLTRKVRQEGLGTVFYIEFSNHLVADSIAEAAGAQTALFHSCHNVSQAELDAGATYLSLMERNLETLRAVMG